MSTPVAHIHPLISRLRETITRDDFLTQQQAADQLGVSLRTLVYWMTEDVTPQKRYRKQLSDWLNARDEMAA